MNMQARDMRSIQLLSEKYIKFICRILSEKYIMFICYEKVWNWKDWDAVLRGTGNGEERDPLIWPILPSNSITMRNNVTREHPCQPTSGLFIAVTRPISIVLFLRIINTSDAYTYIWKFCLRLHGNRRSSGNGPGGRYSWREMIRITANLELSDKTNIH